MSYWLEIHCDAFKDGLTADLLAPSCHTQQSNNPGVLCANDNTSGGRKSLQHTARGRGWKFKEGKWICPGCQER